MALSTTFTQYALEITEFDKNNAKMAISPFKFIQGHQFWYQSKAHIWLPINLKRYTKISHTTDHNRNVDLVTTH